MRRAVFVSLVTVVSLVSAVFVSLPAQAATISPRPVPLVSSPTVTDPSSVEPTGTFDEDDSVAAPNVTSAAKSTVKTPSAKVAFDQASATLTSRDAYSNTYTDKNGLHQREVSASVINVKVADKWQPSSTTLTDAASGGLEDVNQPLAPKFAAKADSSQLLTATSAGHTVTFSLKNAAASTIEHPTIPLTSIGDDQAVYESVLPNTDLHYQVTPGEVKESILVKKLPAAGTTYTWTVDAPGLLLERDQYNDLLFKDSTGTVVFTMPVPVMYDSSGKDGVRQAALTNVSYDLVHSSGSKWTITLTPDRKWLTSSARVYPVVIDPVVDPGSDDVHSFKSSGATFTGKAYVGNTAEASGNYYWRAIQHYNYEQLFGTHVVGTTLNAYATTAAANCAAGGVYQATNFSYNGVGGQLGGLTICGNGSSNSTGDAGITQAIASWVNCGCAGGYLMITGAEGSAYTFKAFNSDLDIYYEDFPSVSGVTAATPVNGAKAPLMPILEATGNDPAGTGLYYQYDFSTSPTFATIAFSSGQQNAGPYQVPQNKLAAGTKYYYRITTWDGYDGWYGVSDHRTATNAAWSFVTNTPPPTPPQASVVPGNGDVVTSLTPTFSTPTVVAPDGNPVTYQFRVSTGTDGKSGQVTTSGWLPAPATGPVTWTPPVGMLQDGGTYTLSVLTNDGIDQYADPSWETHFTVNLRVGTSGPSPTDTAGPVTVNLANGNVNLSFASPTVSTVGGPMGLSFAYNSLQAANQFRGLTGTYYNALNPGQTSTTDFNFTGRTPVLTRTDPGVSFDWGTGAPAPQVPANYFLAKWTGFVQLPTTGGPYTFGVASDSGVKLSVGGSQLIDQWSAAPSGTQWATTNSGSSTTPMPIELDYHDTTGGAAVQLWVKDASGKAVIVPASWFTTTFQFLPAGWSASAPMVGSAGEYVSAQVLDTSVALTDVSGTVHTYTRASWGGYTAPVGEYGVLSLTNSGLVVLTDSDGTVYSFNAQGRVATVTPPTDSRKPATPIATYRPGTGQVDRISDPVSASGSPVTYSRQVVFAYSGDTAASVGLSSADTDGRNANVAGSACQVPAGAAAPPSGMLCRIIYPGHVAGSGDTTELTYNAAGQVIQIVDPGTEVSSFGYDTNGRLRLIRNSLANDWLMAHATMAVKDTSAATITYNALGQAATVTLPAPDGVTAATQPKKTYTYDTANKTTYVDVAGLSLTGSPIGHAEKVTYDSGMRLLTTTSASGLASQDVWSSKDQLLSATDPTGEMTSTIYDSRTDRPTDTYGPAPTTCFAADRTAKTLCQVPGTTSKVLPAHSSTVYDQGLVGLNATYYNNVNFTGAPTLYSLGLAPVTTGGATVATDGSVNADWNTQPLGPGVNADYVAIRLTGTITFPGAGTYTLHTVADEGTRIWLNDVLNLSSDQPQGGADAAGAAITVGPNDPLTQRIRLQFYESTGTASLKLEWVANGAAETVVPGTALMPDYGLVTSSTTDDSIPTVVNTLSTAQVTPLTSSTSYGTSPWLGLATSSTVDPGAGQLNLTSTATYETPGTGWLRQT
ncbi:MAG: hypothetical protein JWN80_2470, partial [Microbacteriaceae bacterium]|nr:hypothetical protein [Microbacteriaceae bacterium]